MNKPTATNIEKNPNQHKNPSHKPGQQKIDYKPKKPMTNKHPENDNFVYALDRYTNKNIKVL
jgi:hypothetical protein